MTRKQIEKAAEATGWNVTIGKRDKKYGGGYTIEFQMYTDFGQDVNETFYVKNLEDIKHEVYERYQNFDPSEEASIWLDDTGHGKNGAPHDMEDVLNDMKEVEGALENLSDALYGNYVEEQKKSDFASQADKLRRDCLYALTSISHRAKPSRLGYRDAQAFANPDKCSKYEEIIYLFDKWVLLDGSGLQYDVNVIPLEEFCEMVDAIINGKEE